MFEVNKWYSAPTGYEYMIYPIVKKDKKPYFKIIGRKDKNWTYWVVVQNASNITATFHMAVATGYPEEQILEYISAHPRNLNRFRERLHTFGAYYYAPPESIYMEIK